MKTHKILILAYGFLTFLPAFSQIKIDQYGKVQITGTITSNVMLSPVGAQTEWQFCTYPSGVDPCLYAGPNDGVLGTATAPIYRIFSNYIWCNGVWLSSDETLKTNFRSISGSLNKIKSVQSFEYDFIINNTDTAVKEKYADIVVNSKNRFGFKAQGIKAVFPELVKINAKTGLYSVDYIGMIPILTEAIKELSAKVDSLELLVGKNNTSSLKSSKTNNTITELEQNSVQKQLVLFQNVPNPFNQNTTISFYLPETINSATIYIYNMQGNQIKALNISEKGNGIIVINGNELNPGMYLYTLVANGKEVDTKRMILTE